MSEVEVVENFNHIPVMLKECIAGLNIKPNGIYVDGTLGMGGHSRVIASMLHGGKLIAFDKAIYGIKKGVTDKNCYSRIDSMFDFKENIKNDFKYIGKYQKGFSGGNLVNVYLPKNITVRKFNELLELMIECNVGFMRFSIRK